MDAAAEDKPITALLNGMLQQDARQRDDLFEIVHTELRRIARRLMAKEHGGHTWQPTDLAHEVYARLMPAEGLEWASRRAFYSIVMLSMKRLLAEHARRKNSLKAGGSALIVALQDEDDGGTCREEYDYLELEDELAALRAIHAEAAEIVELRLFACLSVEETAQCLGMAQRSVERYLLAARDWLRHRRSRHEGG